MDLGNNSVDDQGTDQAEAREMLDSFCKNGFGGDEQKAAVVLGRPVSELREMLDGQSGVDEDLEMKMRGIAKERGFRIG
jgi:hypothetical protein